MSDRPAVLVDAKDAKLFITLNRPDVLNAQNDDMRSLLVGAIERLETDPDLLVAIVSGVGGRAFSAGADLGEVDGGDSRERVQPEARRASWRHFESFRWASKPITVRSFGILRPRRYAVRYTPAAVSSLPAKIAVGRGVRDSNSSAQAAPDSNVYAPSAT